MAGPFLIGGGFQDCEGNIIVNAQLVLELSAPATDRMTGVIQVCPGRKVSYQLDANGNIAGAQGVWSNDLLLPAGTYYRAWVYAANGQLAWGPNCQVLTDVGGFVFLNTWVPNNPV